jgi:hypothetical protein
MHEVIIRSCAGGRLPRPSFLVLSAARFPVLSAARFRVLSAARFLVLSAARFLVLSADGGVVTIIFEAEVCCCGLGWRRWLGAARSGGHLAH